MKTKSYMYNRLFISTRLGKAMLSTLLLFALHNICVGQVASYTDMYGVADSVAAYGAIYADYSQGGHTYTTTVTVYSPSGASSQSSGGNSASGFISIDTDGTYWASTAHEAWCEYAQIAFQAGGSNGQTQACVDTCTACRALRHPKEVVCALALTACEVKALTDYNSAMTACENNNFCNPQHANYNQQQCDNCKETANQNFAAHTALCGTLYVGCRELITPNCDEIQYKKPGPTGACVQCDNWPPW